MMPKRLNRSIIYESDRVNLYTDRVQYPDGHIAEKFQGLTLNMQLENKGGFVMDKYHMRKQDRQINDENEIVEILSKGKYVTMSMCRDNEPYIVSLSYGYDKARNALFFHTALEGLKIDFISCNPKVCATVIDDRGYKMGECSHEYRSVVMNGRISFVENPDEKKNGMEVILNQLENMPSVIKERSLKSTKAYDNVAILRLDITEITGKKGQ